MRHTTNLVIITLALASITTQPASAQDILGIALKPDPPIAVDGDLSEWADIPNLLAFDQGEQVVWGAANWESPADLSGTGQFAWRQEYLFIALKVTDDRLCQTQRGHSLWKGDHIEVYIDAQPDVAQNEDGFGEGQFQIGLSPGNFKSTGDPLTDCKPEAYVYRPGGISAKDILVNAAQTETGWTLEAAIPWTLLGIAKAAKNTVIRVELGLSDTDTQEPQQESLMTLSTEKWAHKRSRLLVAALAGSDGVAEAGALGMALVDALVLPRGKSEAFSFDLAEVPEGRDAVITLNARLNTPKVAGHTHALRLTLNGKPVDQSRLLNKPLRAKSRGGQVYTMAAGERFSTYYAPDFQSPDVDPHYGLVDGYKACLFELNVTDLVKVGANELVIENAAAESVQREMHVGGAALAFRSPPPPPKPKAGPPAGPLDRIVPRAAPRTAYTLKETATALEVTVGGETFRVTSRFSTPSPGWVEGPSEYFSLDQEVEELPELIVIRQTFKNLTSENLALMHRHEVQMGERLKRLWLGGLEQSAGSGNAAVPANPTSFAATSAGGIGLVALDDVFRVHVANFAVDGTLGLADNSLVLAPGAEYTAEWAIVPAEKPGYWAFLNAARRHVGANFEIPGCFAFLRSGPMTEAWPDEQIADFLRFKDADYACASIMYPRYNGHYSHGTAFQRVDHTSYKEAFARWKRLAPEVQSLVYFHCFLDVTEDAPERFADARTLRPDGTQANYGKAHQNLFFPTEDNSYGPEIAKSIDIILDDIGADGVYWDEHEYSRWGYHYGEPWDGVSGEIDPKTMRVKRLKSSVALLTQAWRSAQARRIMARGPLIGNGAPHTKAMAGLRFPCFVETGSITNCTRNHLYSPIALGDHLTERSELDAYHVMLAALDYGCVYHWYGDMTVLPTHHTLTRYMYPITPMELHEGYIIGEERIITNRSGLFGWGDDAAHEVHVFNDEGIEVEDFDAPQVTEGGKTFTELRIAEDWAAAIIRR